MRWNTFPEMENFEFANRIYFTFTCLTSYHMSLCCAVIGRYTELSLIEYVGMADEGNETVLWRTGPEGGVDDGGYCGRKIEEK